MTRTSGSPAVVLGIPGHMSVALVYVISAIGIIITDIMFYAGVVESNRGESAH